MSEAQSGKEARTRSEEESKVVKASMPVRPVKKELYCSGGTGDGEAVGKVGGPSNVGVPAASSAGTAPAEPRSDETEPMMGEEEEGVVPRKLRDPRAPTKYEVEQHNLTHIPIPQLVSPLCPG